MFYVCLTSCPSSLVLSLALSPSLMSLMSKGGRWYSSPCYRFPLSQHLRYFFLFCASNYSSRNCISLLCPDSWSRTRSLSLYLTLASLFPLFFCIGLTDWSQLFAIDHPPHNPTHSSNFSRFYPPCYLFFSFWLSVLSSSLWLLCFSSQADKADSLFIAPRLLSRLVYVSDYCSYIATISSTSATAELESQDTRVTNLYD